MWLLIYMFVWGLNNPPKRGLKNTSMGLKDGATFIEKSEGDS